MVLLLEILTGLGTWMVEASVVKNDAVKMHSTRALSKDTMTIVSKYQLNDTA